MALTFLQKINALVEILLFVVVAFQLIRVQFAGISIHAGPVN